MNYPDSVQFLYALGNEARSARLGLERMRALMAALGDPQARVAFVHVAGTNGKGSTCAMIESGLRAAGRRTGLFTSPHLVEPTERIRIGGAPVPPERFAAAFERVHQTAEAMPAMDMHPTYFETVAAMAMLVFREEGVDAAVLEVGLGGRLDATNVVTPRMTVITPVDYDHEALLGKSLEAIAGEKAGILKPGVPAVFAAQRPEVEAVLAEAAGRAGAPVGRTSQWPVEDLQVDARGSSFRVGGLAIRCPLAGEHQVENARTAAMALARLGTPPEAIERGIAAARWPGRLQQVSQNPEILLDGAHNPAGARALAAYLDRFYSQRRVTLIYGAMRDKAIAEMGGILFPRAERVIATAPRQARAARPETVVSMFDHPRLEATATLAEALVRAREADVTVITGSLFLVGEAEALLGC
ncbi:MAG: folylpolyglutamate synthase/dihydrofolate synthase family protein [Bryobacteraceae bacterium]